MKMECTKCNYHFQKDKVPKRCPYCGKEGYCRETKTAQDLLNEVIEDE